MTDSDSPKRRSTVVVHMASNLMVAFLVGHRRPARSPDGESFVGDEKSWA